MSVLRQIKEYDPVSFVTAIGDVTLSLRFYWISSQGNPFGLPRCDMKLEQTLAEEEASRTDEVTGLDVHDWTEGIAETALAEWELRLALFQQVLAMCNGEGSGMNHFKLNYAAPFVLEPLWMVVATNPLAYEDLTFDLRETRWRPSARHLGIMLGNYEYNPHKDEDRYNQNIFWTSLTPNVLHRLRRLALDIHTQIEVMKC